MNFVVSELKIDTNLIDLFMFGTLVYVWSPGRMSIRVVIIIVYLGNMTHMSRGIFLVHTVMLVFDVFFID